MRTTRTIAAATMVALVAVGCGSESNSTTADGSDKFEQTWPKSYGDTVCRQWLNKMTPKQRFVAAADMLTSARNSGDGGEGLPPDSMINTFKADIDEACVIPTHNITEIAATVYMVGRSQYRP